MKSINLSFNPSYACNLRCEFCYLSKEQLKDATVIPTEKLFQRLQEISVRRFINHVDIYGGEISLLKDDYLKEILSILRIFYKGKFNLITNFTKIEPYFLLEDFEVSVSWDYVARAKHEEVLENMISFNKGFHILMLASRRLMDEEIVPIIKILNKIPNLLSLEIKPYSQSIHNSINTDFLAFESWVQKWIDLRDELKFKLINIDKITNCLSSESSSWSDDHIYLTPHGELAVLDFTPEGKEYFKIVKTIEEFERWSEHEKSSFSNDPICGNCKYLGHCLSEHLQKVSNKQYSCSGYFNLLENNINLI